MTKWSWHFQSYSIAANSRPSKKHVLVVLQWFYMEGRPGPFQANCSKFVKIPKPKRSFGLCSEVLRQSLWLLNPPPTSEGNNDKVPGRPSKGARERADTERGWSLIANSWRGGNCLREIYVWFELGSGVDGRNYQNPSNLPSVIHTHSFPVVESR